MSMLSRLKHWTNIHLNTGFAEPQTYPGIPAPSPAVPPAVGLELNDAPVFVGFPSGAHTGPLGATSSATTPSAGPLTAIIVVVVVALLVVLVWRR